jgi:teichuronic acid biosynthesis glycosyltransferase TuaC
MYPNPVWPTYGVFVDELAKDLSSKCQLSVVAPIPIFPFLNRTSKYKNFDNIPQRIDYQKFDVQFPRFFFIPKYLKFTDWLGYLSSVFPLLLKRRRSFDVIYVHWGYPDGLVAFICGRLLKKKVVIHVHGNESVCFFESSIRKLLVKAYLKWIDRFIAVSGDLKDKLVKYYHVRKESVSIVSNGIDPSIFIPIPKADARARLGLPRNHRTIVTVARLSKEKRVDILIEAFSVLTTMIQGNVSLYIIGDGPERMNLESAAKSKGKQLSEKITFIGNVAREQVPIWLSAADIFCLSSDREGCPVSVIEALRCHTPVVATKVGAVPDLIPDENYGFVVPPGHPQDFAEAMAKALNRPWDAQIIDSHAKDYTWERTADAVMDVFDSLK